MGLYDLFNVWLGSLIGISLRRGNPLICDGALGNCLERPHGFHICHCDNAIRLQKNHVWASYHVASHRKRGRFILPLMSQTMQPLPIPGYVCSLRAPRHQTGFVTRFSVLFQNLPREQRGLRSRLWRQMRSRDAVKLLGIFIALLISS